MTDEVAERASRDQRRRRRLLRKLGAEQDDLCFYCDQLLDYPDPDVKYQNNERNTDQAASFDHVIPRSQNGRTGANLVIAHRGCNTHRNVLELTEEQTQKFLLLNERRKHLFDETIGKTAPSTFGIISLSSIVLADKVDDPETPHTMRGRICRFCQRYCFAMRSIRRIKDSDAWQYVSNLVLKDYLEKLETANLMHKTYIASILKGIRMNDMRKRFELHSFNKRDYNSTDEDFLEEN
jgi:5-methylcytosine-specific restriction endonuclease McrA